MTSLLQLGLTRLAHTPTISLEQAFTRGLLNAFQKNTPYLDLPMASLHALIIGIESYPHLEGGNGCRAVDTFGLNQLTSPYPSAISVAETLVSHYRHPTRSLANIRLCLSPGSQHDLEISPILLGRITGPTSGSSQAIREAFDSWHSDCDKSKDDLAFFYFCGHGIRRVDRLLLLQDFGAHAKRPFEACINFEEVLEGMRHVKAQTQCFLVDACQENPYAMGQYRVHPKVLPWVDTNVSWQTVPPSDMPSILQVFSSQPGGLSQAPVGGRAPVAEDFRSLMEAATPNEEISLGALTVELSKRQLKRHLEKGDFPAGEIRLEGHPGASFCSPGLTQVSTPDIQRSYSLTPPFELIESLGLRSHVPQGHLRLTRDTAGWTIDSYPALFVNTSGRKRSCKLNNLNGLRGAAYLFGTGAYPRIDFSTSTDSNNLRMVFQKTPSEAPISYLVGITP
jgi:hypothetical protein